MNKSDAGQAFQPNGLAQFRLIWATRVGLEGLTYNGALSN
jgi:hypothetical protein